jgi:hypothetical protein
LVEFVEAHLGLFSTLKSAKEQMESVAKAAREAAKKSTTQNPTEWVMITKKALRSDPI